MLLVSGGQALANHVECGDVITQDTKLDSDLIDCPGDGLEIGADNVTLDLNGHTVDGDGDARPGLGCDTGIRNGGFDNCSRQDAGHGGVTIRNGTVREFAHGVQVIIADHNSLLHLRLYDNSGFGGIVTYLMSNGRIKATARWTTTAPASRSTSLRAARRSRETSWAGTPATGSSLPAVLPETGSKDNVAFGNAHTASSSSAPGTCRSEEIDPSPIAVPG